MDEPIKCLIIGSGPAGYTAAIYTSRANLKPVLYEGNQPGGQLTTTTVVENYPGYTEGITGQQMMEDLRNQAIRFGAEIRSGRVSSVNFEQRPFEVTINADKKLYAETVIICTGAAPKYLGLADEKKYLGSGVSTCATCDGFFYRNRVIAVVGGGDTACEEALYLSSIAKKVYLIVRKNYLRASKVMQDRVFGNEKIEVLFNTNTLGLYGDEFLEGAHLVEYMGAPDERKFDIAIDGFFLAIGHQPNTGIFKGQVELDEAGYIKTHGNSTATNVKGVFAAGDVADPVYQQAIIAAGSGAKAAKDVELFLINN